MQRKPRDCLAGDEVDLGRGSGSVNLSELSGVAYGACKLSSAGSLEALGVYNCNYRNGEYVSELNESCNLSAVSSGELCSLIGSYESYGCPVNACECGVSSVAELSAELYSGVLVSESRNKVSALHGSGNRSVVLCEIIVACEGDVVCRKDSSQLLSLCDSLCVVLSKDIGNAGLSGVCSLALRPRACRLVC